MKIMKKSILSLIQKVLLLKILNVNLKIVKSSSWIYIDNNTNGSKKSSKRKNKQSKTTVVKEISETKPTLSNNNTISHIHQIDNIFEKIMKFRQTSKAFLLIWPFWIVLQTHRFSIGGKPSTTTMPNINQLNFQNMPSIFQNLYAQNSQKQALSNEMARGGK